MMLSERVYTQLEGHFQGKRLIVRVRRGPSVASFSPGKVGWGLSAVLLGGKLSGGVWNSGERFDSGEVWVYNKAVRDKES